jgi:hypothetical protein
MKLLYLVLRQVAGEWKMPQREWCEEKSQFAIMFEGRTLTSRTTLPAESTTHTLLSFKDTSIPA